MPMIKSPSKKARQENTKREIKAGYPPKRAAAMSYANQRKERAKKASRSK